MRTTLTIDEVVLKAAKGIAARQRKALGEVIFELSHESLTHQTSRSTQLRNGVPLLPDKPDAVPVTLEWVNQLRDDIA